MSKTAFWHTSQYSDSNIAHETDSIFYAQDLVRYMKFQSSVSLKYCVADALRYTKNGTYISVPAGSFLLTNRGADMECLPGKSGGKVLFVYFTDALVADVYRNRCYSESVLLDDPVVPAAPVFLLEHLYDSHHALHAPLRHFAQQLSTAAVPQRDIGPDVFYSLAETLLHMQQHFSRQMNRLPARSAAIREELFRRLLQTEALMRDSWQQELTIGHMARHACLSPYHFQRTFRAAYGQSPGQWFRQLKLEKAKEMLTSGKWMVGEVAVHCGFADVFSFSKAFKKVYGVNPSAVRH